MRFQYILHGSHLVFRLTKALAPACLFYHCCMSQFIFNHSHAQPRGALSCKARNDLSSYMLSWLCNGHMDLVVNRNIHRNFGSENATFNILHGQWLEGNMISHTTGCHMTVQDTELESGDGIMPTLPDSSLHWLAPSGYSFEATSVLSP